MENLICPVCQAPLKHRYIMSTISEYWCDNNHNIYFTPGRISLITKNFNIIKYSTSDDFIVHFANARPLYLPCIENLKDLDALRLFL